jgi:hypothetical protein
MPSRNFPIQKLLFFVAQDFDQSLIAVVADFVSQLATRRDWTIQPPVFVNEGEGSVRTLGGFVCLYNELPPNDLPVRLDRQNLEDVKALVNELTKFSSENGLAIELELDGGHVGAVEDGEPDKSLQVGLLSEWERVLSERGG